MTPVATLRGVLSVAASVMALTAFPVPVPLGIGADTAAWISAESAKTELKRMAKTGGRGLRVRGFGVWEIEGESKQGEWIGKEEKAKSM